MTAGKAPRRKRPYVTDEQRSVAHLSSTPWAVGDLVSLDRNMALARAFQNRQFCDGAAKLASDLVH